MIKQSDAKIFLAEERGLKETNWFRSQQTFNAAGYYNEHKQPVATIYLLNDETLDAGHTLTMPVEEDTYIVLLPVIGAITYKGLDGEENFIAAGQVQLINIKKGNEIQLRNPFKNGLVNFLQIWIKTSDKIHSQSKGLSTYDVNEFMNSLMKISPNHLGSKIVPFSLSIGKFAGRGETVYTLNSERKIFLAFVITGVFEVEGRLLHEKDALALWDYKEVEMEALSNDAIIFTIEV